MLVVRMSKAAVGVRIRVFGRCQVAPVREFDCVEVYVYVSKVSHHLLGCNMVVIVYVNSVTVLLKDFVDCDNCVWCECMILFVVVLVGGDDVSYSHELAGFRSRLIR